MKSGAVWFRLVRTTKALALLLKAYAASENSLRSDSSCAAYNTKVPLPK